MNKPAQRLLPDLVDKADPDGDSYDGELPGNSVTTLSAPGVQQLRLDQAADNLGEIQQMGYPGGSLKPVSHLSGQAEHRLRNRAE